MSDFNNIFGDFMQLFGFGSAEAPPKEVPLRLLGLVPPASYESIRKAFRAKVIEVHPDMMAAFNNTDLQDIAQKGRGELPEIRELVWARDCALAQAAKPVTTNKGVSVRPLTTVTPPESKVHDTAEGEPYVCRRCGDELRLPKRIRHRRDTVGCFYCDTCFEIKRDENKDRWDRHSLRRCKVCGVGIDARYNRTIHCSDICKNKAYAERQRDVRARRRGSMICEICGETFTPKRKGASYCSNKCRQKQYRRVTANS